MVVVDSDIIIDFLNNIESAVYVFRNMQEQGEEIFTTSVNSFELFKGFEKYSNEKISKLNEFFNLINILDFDFGSSKKAANIFETLKSQGNMVDLADIMIASIAIQNNQKIVTRNIKHFSKISDIEIERV